ncbi:hypothetical protein KSP40_PGU011203 [Platanthera guangdongensis]|uniref:Uncharacterized protein n=1 Tax=Platanthera guangdongensis TaxID=2320717 RepID=A0ABR2LYS0_9ASPA
MTLYVRGINSILEIDPQLQALEWLGSTAPADRYAIEESGSTGSEITFFKNGICQGVAFKDLFGGRYYPAASLYTLPNQPSCEVRFNFGPNFNCFPLEFDGSLIPRPMSEVPYHGYDGRSEGVVENGHAEKPN